MCIKLVVDTSLYYDARSKKHCLAETVFPHFRLYCNCLRKSTEVTSYSKPRLPYPFCYLKNYDQAAAVITLHLFCYFLLFLVGHARAPARYTYTEPRQVLCSCCFATSAIPLLRSQLNNLSFFLFLPCSFFTSPLRFRGKVMQYTDGKKGHLFLEVYVEVNSALWFLSSAFSRNVRFRSCDSCCTCLASAMKLQLGLERSSKPD